uniref:Uncharacterized protein n=1 Tax=Romanomermis culicivorax TaxID=13658 RepID=A0A915HYA9_ROMCU
MYKTNLKITRCAENFPLLYRFLRQKLIVDLKKPILVQKVFFPEDRQKDAFFSVLESWENKAEKQSPSKKLPRCFITCIFYTFGFFICFSPSRDKWNTLIPTKEA